MMDESIEEVATGLQAIAGALRCLGNADASTPMGAIEAFGKVVEDQTNLLSVSLDNIAEAIKELAAAVRCHR